MDKRTPVTPFFMAYPLPEEEYRKGKESDDRDYFRQLYPQMVKRYLRVIVETLDRMETKESYLYDEYPDKIRLERLAEIILETVPLEKNMARDTQRNLIKVLLLDEVIQRRIRNQENINNSKDYF